MDIEQALLVNQEALIESEERFSDILGSLLDVVWSVTPDYSRWFYLNASAAGVFGRSMVELIANPNLLREMVHPDDKKEVQKSQELLLIKGHQDIEYRIIWPNGEIHWIQVRTRVIRDSKGNPSRFNSIASEITERKLIQAQLEHDALYDELTGLPNRTLFTERLNQAIERSNKDFNYCFAVLFLDLDQFSIVNDGLGHLSGDFLLMEVANRLRQCQCEGDTLARLRGDEFVILADNINKVDEAIALNDTIRRAFSPPVAFEDREIFVTFSVGIAMNGGEHHYKESSVLLHDADTAMYRAKARGQGGYEVFRPEMRAQVVRRLQMESDLRHAIKNADLSIYYQPIISLDDGQLQSIEALVRWQHPQKGAISPVDFIPLAEETGLVREMDYWVLNNACRELRQWQQLHSSLSKLSVNVNLSANHFSHRGLIESVDRILQETGLDASCLKLEVTESAVIKNPQSAARLLQQLRERGVQVCLDDFGTGYSSLSYLNSLPFNVLKIDRSFIKKLSATTGSNEILKAIIQLGSNLKMNVVAEGVETDEQLDQLRDLNCPYAQGFWFSRPIDSQSMTKLLPNLINRELSWKDGTKNLSWIDY